ncbi:aminoglycoside phosphotransferase family protein [Paenibacillus mendelii]|uniref:Aminoglycoside phosphotransferase family protein n=1 Tax=Paenibacillus mendelii TaxID=206163 RepID=A0ABV6JEW2_9BACL|nr:aminoglycoside phosphotransferase family protein [Paenibacillus mendelii]MCQ6557206.1 aminoglycoside phosphotransferase family protein [Paenibacillus mendelii]
MLTWIFHQIEHVTQLQYAMLHLIMARGCGGSMEEIIHHLRVKVEELLNARVDEINKIDNVPNNSVYKVIVSDKPYIFKRYRQRNWPEDGKLMFVHHKLMEHQIGCAKIIAFDRNDSYFQTGFLLEECLPGVNADHAAFDEEFGKEFYGKLARLISNIHEIPIENYGYIGAGIADYTSFIEFIQDKYDEIANGLITKKLFDQNHLLEIKKMVIDKLRSCDSLPSVLCHGDLSTKNVIINEAGNLTLIDWDDAMSYNWLADLSRMTYWMKFKYNQHEYELYRNIVLEHYSTVHAKSDFEVYENTFHVWIGLDHLNYNANAPQYQDMLTYFNETVERLGK